MEKEETLPVWHQTIDFDALMREARKHITALSGKLWTDHNSSDPGITQMEVLAFCIADLSYRTSFNVEDILAGYKGDKQLDIDLPLANSALPNKPVTIKDLRKVLLDMPHPNDPDKLLIRNAFPVIAEGTEVPFFAVSNKGEETFLSYTDTYLPIEAQVSLAPANNEAGVFAYNDDALPTTKDEAAEDDETGPKEFVNNDEIVLNGLYGIQIEFEEDVNEVEDFLKDLNQNYFEENIDVGSNSYNISVLFPYWDDINWSLRNASLNPGTLNYRKLNDQSLEDYFFAVDKLNYDDYFYDYYAELDLDNYLITAFIKLDPETPIESSITLDGQTYEFSANFLDWNELSNGVKRDYDLITPKPLDLLPSDVEASNVSIDGVDQLYDLKSIFSFDKNGTTKVITLLTRITFDKDLQLPNESDVKVALKNKFAEVFEEKIALEKAIYEKMKTVSASMYSNYIAKLNKVFSYLYNESGGIWQYIGKYRNLCEDYSKFTASRIQEVALFGKLIVSPDFNINELLAEVYFRIDQFLHPLVKFNTLDEITEKGYIFEDIFDGPLLKNGFIEDADLENLKRRSVVYTSDLIRILMDVPGVEAVEDFNISSYIDNRLMGRNVINCLSLTNPEVYKPRLSISKSGLSVCVNNQVETTEFLVIEKWYLQKLSEIKLLQKQLNHTLNLRLPLGDDMEIEEYKSIQHDYPEIYGIGEYGLPAEATEERKAQAKQLKGYLLLFEQMMANYLQQVAHLPELFSFNRSIESTYANQPLYNVPDAEPLFQGFVQSNDTWETFKQDVDNSYETALQEGESEEEWRSRRNRFLSQLIGRFGESFEAYSVQLFNQHKSILDDPQMIGLYQQKRGEVLDQLIDTKIAFAEDLERVTGGRYQSFDTTWFPTLSGTGSWNNGNIGAYKLRLCRLLGIENTNNQLLFETGANGEDIEGMHVLEHILLRPRLSGNSFIGIQNRVDESGSFAYDADKDPYSFRVTIVLPINAGRFQEKAFRKFTERLIQLETPAHIYVDFRWMTAGCGKNFEHHYSLWKDAMFSVQPHLFQNNTQVAPQKVSNPTAASPKAVSPADASPTNTSYTPATAQPAEYSEAENEIVNLKTPVSAASDYSDKLAVSSEIPIVKGTFSLQDNLIQALNTPCELEVKFYDDKDIIHPVINDKITFEDKTTDVFNIRVSELQGTLTVFKWNASTSNWEQKDAFEFIDETYIDVTSLLGSDSGLTSNYGGTGEYLVTYQVEDRSVQQIINVTKEIIPASINISNGMEMLDFNTETDGTFTISSKVFQGYFLEMMPVGEGIAMISSQNGLAPTPLALTKPGNQVQFSTIYDLYGAGTYYITYEIDGQSTYASIEITVEVSISTWNGEAQLTPNENNTIHLPYELRNVNMLFDPTEGELSVYDQNAVLTNDDPIELDGLPIGQVLDLKKVSSLYIDRDNDGIWQDGRTYLFRYKHSGKQAEVFIHFEKDIIQVEAPTVAFLINDEPTDFPTIILPASEMYALLCSPVGGIRSIFKEEESGTVLIEEVEINAENAMQEMNLDDIEEVHGEGNYSVSYANENGEGSLQFTLVKQSDPVEAPTVTFLINDEPTDFPTVIVPANDMHALLCSPIGGIRSIFKEDDSGTILIEEIEINAENAMEEMNFDDIEEIHGEGNYSVSYANENGEGTLQFTLVKQSDPVEAQSVAFLINDEPTDFPTVIVPANDMHALLCSPVGGIRSIFKEEDSATVLIEEVEITEENAFEEINLDDIEEMHGEGNYSVSYANENGEETLQFSLVKRFDPVFEELNVEIFDSLTESYVQPEDDIYTLVYDYQNEDQSFDFSFSMYPGMFTLNKGDVLFLQEELEGNRGYKRDELLCDDYVGEYTVNDAQLNFTLNVINLDPTFILQGVNMIDQDIYSATGIILDPCAKAYIWRLDETFVSNAKQPQLILDFTQTEEITIQLTVHLDDYEAQYSLTVSSATLNELILE